MSSDTMARYEDGKANSHNVKDPEDGYSLADRARVEKKQEKKEEQAAAEHKPPTAAAKEHGNKPSRGAQIDEQIENEEREYLKQKGKI